MSEAWTLAGYLAAAFVLGGLLGFALAAHLYGGLVQQATSNAREAMGVAKRLYGVCVCNHRPGEWSESTWVPSEVGSQENENQKGQEKCTTDTD